MAKLWVFAFYILFYNLFIFGLVWLRCVGFPVFALRLMFVFLIGHFRFSCLSTQNARGTSTTDWSPPSLLGQQCIESNIKRWNILSLSSFDATVTGMTYIFTLLHDSQDIAAESVKKRRRATKKPYSRSIVGATLEVIQKRRTEKPEVRDAAREAALRYAFFHPFFNPILYWRVPV